MYIYMYVYVYIIIYVMYYIYFLILQKKENKLTGNTLTYPLVSPARGIKNYHLIQNTNTQVVGKYKTPLNTQTC